MLVTATAGHSKLPNSQSKVVLLAAKRLLEPFDSAYRKVWGHTVKLIPAFVERKHPCWSFNNVYTLMSWKGCPKSSNQTLQVI